jgi:hypothetical protein
MSRDTGKILRDIGTIPQILIDWWVKVKEKEGAGQVNSHKAISFCTFLFISERFCNFLSFSVLCIALWEES